MWLWQSTVSAFSHESLVELLLAFFLPNFICTMGVRCLCFLSTKWIHKTIRSREFLNCVTQWMNRTYYNKIDPFHQIKSQNPDVTIIFQYVTPKIEKKEQMYAVMLSFLFISFLVFCYIKGEILFSGLLLVWESFSFSFIL